MKKYKFLFCIVFVLFAIFSCEQNDEQNLQYDKSSITILRHPGILRFWTPKNATFTSMNQEDFDIIDSLISEYVKAYNDTVLVRLKEVHPTNTDIGSEGYFINFKDYKRQYVPYLDSVDNRMALVNCFCNNPSNSPLTDIQTWIEKDSTAWRTYFMVPEGLGKCYFRFRVNLKQRNYSRF